MYSLTLEINQICNLRCRYCYLGDKSGAAMEMETAKRAINFAFKNVKIHKDKKLWIDFIGGEPLISFETIKKLVEYIEDQNKQYQYILAFSMTTNAVLVSKEILDYLAAKKFSIKISLDGEKDVNDRNRISLDGSSVHDKVIERIGLLHEYEKNTGKFIQVTNVITKNNFEDYCEGLVYLTKFAKFKMIDSSIDISVPWTDEELYKLEMILQRALDYFLDNAARNEGFHWGFAHRMVRLQDKKKRFYICGGGIVSVYVRTDGSIFPCPGNLNQKMSIGRVYEGYDNKKLDFFKSLHGINNKKCRNCKIYKSCMVNSCVMQNILFTNDVNTPAPVLCNMQQLLYRLYIKNSNILSKVQM